MFFVMFATDKPGHAQVRASVREPHRLYLRDPGTHKVRVHLGGPTLDEESEQMNGTMLVIEADSIDEVRAFVADDPYSQAGLFSAVEIRPWNWGLGQPKAS